MPMNLGLGLGLSRRAVSGVAVAFTPASLFALGEQGGWFRPNQTGTTFFDFQGVTPNPAANDPVGLLFDLSGNLVRGSNLITNGDFTSGITGWASFQGAILSHTGSALKISGNGTINFPGANQAVTVVAGRWYEVFFDVVANPGPGSIGMEFSTAASAGAPGFGFLGGAGLGIRRLYALPTQTTMWMRPINDSQNANFDVDNVVVREIAGRHAFQGTAGNRPLLRVGGNGVRFIENVSADTLNWTAPAGTYTIAYVIPDGTVTILTGQALSGATNIMLATQIVEYVAVNRALTGGETSGLTAYLQGVANP